MSRRRAFSLVEILVAGAIISAALLPIAGLSCTQRKMAAVNDEQLKTMSIARAALHELAPLEFDVLTKRASNLDGAIELSSEFKGCGIYHVEVRWTIVDEEGLGLLTARTFNKDGVELQKLSKLVACPKMSLTGRPLLKSSFGQES